MHRALPHWMLALLIIVPLIVMLLWSGIIVFERMSANQRITRVAQELGLAPDQRLTSARHCFFFDCRIYQWFPTAQTFAAFDQRVTRMNYQPMFERQPWNRREQPWVFGYINTYTRHQFTQNGSRDGTIETIQWVFEDQDGRRISIYFHPIKDAEDSYMFDGQRMQENMVTIIMDI